MCLLLARFVPSMANVNLAQVLGPNTGTEIDRQVQYVRLCATIVFTHMFRNSNKFSVLFRHLL